MRANRFRIILAQTTPDALEKGEAIAGALRRSGIPNFYGEQRFGTGMRNLDRAESILNRGMKRGKKDQFIVSALQSALFNLWLKERIERGDFNAVIAGDLAKKTDTGGMFVIEDLPEAIPRFANREIVYTGPIYGHKMRPAGSVAEAHERRLLEALGLMPQTFKPLRAPGSRRAAILNVDDLALSDVEGGLRFDFTLPSGAYATTVMREFTRAADNDTV